MLRLHHFRNQLTCGLLALACAISSSASANELLTIGSDAPALDIEHWVQDGGGKFEAVREFKAGKVYVVEFWATWCPPCIQSMPHLAELQERYGDKVQIVSISDEDLERVEAFLERDVDGKDMTFRKLTSVYCLTTDPDRSVYQDYMNAAEQGGIPTAFIVGKDAKIEWIGHPMDLDETLSQVVEDKWDRDAYAAEIAAQQKMQEEMGQIMQLVGAAKFDEALAGLDKLLAEFDSLDLKIFKLQVLAQAGKSKQAEEHLSAIFQGARTEAVQTDMVAWNVYQMAAQGLLEDPALVDIAVKAAGAAAKGASEASEKSSLLDTIAHLIAHQGSIDEAIQIERQALELSTGRAKLGIQQFLKELEAENSDKQ